MKFLVLGVVLFFTYRLFFKPSLEGPKDPEDSLNKSNPEFSDYEEVE